MKKWIKVVGIISVVSVVGVLLLGAVAFAQRPTDGTFGPGGRMGHPSFGMRGSGAFGPMGHPGGSMGGEVLAEALGMSVEDFQAALADGQTPQEIAQAQGIDWADVEAALQADAEERLQQAVEDGKLTQEQADAILERMAEHPFDGGAFMKRPGGRPDGQTGRRPGGPEMDRGNELPEVLGMTQEDFSAAMEEGRKQVLVDIVESQGMTMEEVALALYDQAVERLESAVADGKLGQEQADQILEKITERRDACVNDGDCTLAPPRPSRPSRPPMPFGNSGR
ncbi:MAG TPA: hypothetical protein G4N96_13380 [Chloroflexi bacterium]|nr:MAG: hypothetical protein B6243_10975 [Anaerolineaceae bacterium 4572_5.2]HEY86092.1 hypothetical protein [Chloroflexota bacterium]